MKVSSCSIIFIPSVVAQITENTGEPCNGPTFENPKDVSIYNDGVYVDTTEKGSDIPCQYFYPMHQIARVKTVF